MLVRMKGLVKRGGVWLYRREVPRRLRSIIGREVKRTLGTGDLNAAQRRWQAVNADVDRLFAEAEAAVKNPSIGAYRAVEEWRKSQAVRPDDDGHEDALNLHLTTLLERDDLDPTKRVAVEALLRAFTGVSGGSLCHHALTARFLSGHAGRRCRGGIGASP